MLLVYFLLNTKHRKVYIKSFYVLIRNGHHVLLRNILTIKCKYTCLILRKSLNVFELYFCMLQSVFIVIRLRGASRLHIFCTEFPKNTNEEETETTDNSTCNLTHSSDIKQYLNCVTLWNKILTNEEVIMIVSFGVLLDSIYILIIILNPIHSLFFSFLFKMIFIYETYPHSSV